MTTTDVIRNRKFCGDCFDFAFNEHCEVQTKPNQTKPNEKLRITNGKRNGKMRGLVAKRVLYTKIIS